MALPLEDKEMYVPEIQDKKVPVRSRFVSLVVLTLQTALILVIVYLSGLVLCSLLGRWLGRCVCSVGL